MSQRYPSHNRIKNSGIQWLGQIPEHWEILQSQRLFSERKERMRLDDEQLTASQKYGVIPQSEFMCLEDQKVMQVYLNSEILKHVEPNDFVISMRSFQGGLEYCGYRGCVSSAYVGIIPLKHVITGFFKYLFKSSPYIQALQSTSNLVRDGQALRFQNFSQVALPVIPELEQQQIAMFLDHETAKIDALIEKQLQLIALLVEKGQAVISHAVTKGLHPDSPMRNSGIEWLGTVPKHWKILALKNVISMKSGDGITSDSIEPEGNYPVFGGNGLRGYTSKFTHDGNYVLIGRQGALCGNVNYAKGKFWASEHAVVATPTRVLDLKWLGEMVRAMNLNQYSESAAQPGLSMAYVGNIRTVLPPVVEQQEIARHLTAKTRQLDALREKSESTVELLQERRTAIISAAVTGKIDVRGWKRPNSEARFETEMDLA